MAELVAIAFDTPTDADRALTELQRLQREYLIDLEDAVVVTRGQDGKVRLKQSVNLVGYGASTGTLWGGLWGALVGLLFLNPLIGFATGATLGAGAGALSGKLADYGINDSFIKELGRTLDQDCSALFVLIRKAQPERVLAELEGFRGTVLRTSLSPDQERRLQEALSGAGAVASPFPGGVGARQGA